MYKRVPFMLQRSQKIIIAQLTLIENQNNKRENFLRTLRVNDR